MCMHAYAYIFLLKIEREKEKAKKHAFLLISTLLNHMTHMFLLLSYLDETLKEKCCYYTRIFV